MWPSSFSGNATFQINDDSWGGLGVFLYDSSLLAYPHCYRLQSYLNRALKGKLKSGMPKMCWFTVGFTELLYSVAACNPDSHVIRLGTIFMSEAPRFITSLSKALIGRRLSPIIGIALTKHPLLPLFYICTLYLNRPCHMQISGCFVARGLASFTLVLKQMSLSFLWLHKNKTC